MYRCIKTLSRKTISNKNEITYQKNNIYYVGNGNIAVDSHGTRLYITDEIKKRHFKIVPKQTF
jgi:hypothetical protein